MSDPSYRDLIKSTIQRVTAQYAIIDDNEHFFETASLEELQTFYRTCTPESLQCVNLKINPQSFLDVLLLEIRRESISYASRKKRERLSKEKALLKEIEDLEAKITAEDGDDEGQILIDEQEAKKIDLDAIYSFQAQGAYIRARARQLVEGEKPTRLFCAL